MASCSRPRNTERAFCSPARLPAGSMGDACTRHDCRGSGDLPRTNINQCTASACGLSVWYLHTGPCQVPCQVPDPADAASSGHAGPGQPVSQMFALSCPISMIQSHLSLSRTRTLGSGAHSLLGRNPTLRPLEQTWAPDLQRSKLESQTDTQRLDLQVRELLAHSLARTHREAPITSPDSHAPSSSRPPLHQVP